MRSEWPWALVVAMFAGVLDLGQLHNLQTSDSLVPSLVSLQAWTPFFWQQDRYGMLIPLVFTFIAHPLYNQLAITWASFFAGLCSVMAVAHLFFCASRAWRLVGFVSIAMLVGITPAPIVFDVLGPGQFFTMPLAMGLGARCLFVESAGVVRRCLGFLMLCAAAWINCVSPIWLCLLCAAKQLGDVRQNAPKHGRRPIVCNGFYLALLVAFGAGLVAMRAAPVQDVRLTDVATPWVMLKTCACLAQTYARLYAASPTMIVGSAMLVGMAASNAYWRGSVAAFGRGAQQACGASASYMLLCASQRWVVQGKYHYRFGCLLLWCWGWPAWEQGRGPGCIA